MSGDMQAEEKLHNGRDAEEGAVRGRLKIFFGYAPGVGKTYSMLKAARDAKRRGTDVAAGYIGNKNRQAINDLCRGMEMLPPRVIERDGSVIREFDLDGALKRKPGLILVDELAHINDESCRHVRRYQDIEELLSSGIDVYTTVNVQNIESLNDQVVAVTGVEVRERIPDSVFDRADQVTLVDIEPRELMERLGAGKVYPKEKEVKAAGNFFTLENLTALREIALRRCADRMNILTENVRGKSQGGYQTDEHILVCLSSAPSNAKIIRTAARMAAAFRCSFTALFVETSGFSAMSPENKQRLRNNMRLARQLGANLESSYGDDIAQQIADFARLSGVTKIVIGRSAVSHRSIFRKTNLTDKLIALAPTLDVHIIPDTVDDASKYREAKVKSGTSLYTNLTDIAKSIGILCAASLIGVAFNSLGFSEVNIITVYILAVLITSIVTKRRIYSLMSSIISVAVFNFLFTDPVYSMKAYGSGYPITFVVMFLAAFITGDLAARLKNNAKQSAQAAFRTKILFDTNRMLQSAPDEKEIAAITSGQLIKLLGRDIILYMNDDGRLSEPSLFPAGDSETCISCLSDKEKEAAQWVLKNNKHAGATTDTFSFLKCLYLAIRINDRVYGVVGIVVGDTPLDSFENNILLSILGECALAMENRKNAREKEEAAVLAKNEQLRANILRAISHDLRTPLTSISGNASNLMSNAASFDENTKLNLYTDIYDDSMWLINLVENLLAVTRLEENRMKLRITSELVEDVISEALRHINRKSREHIIKVEQEDDLLLAKMDARLIVQVIINIVNNAIKYTPQGSVIEIRTYTDNDNMAVIEIKDDGPGISDEIKDHIFDMFYSGANKVADSRRSLGLGLSLCKSIVTAHGGTITVEDNVPHGAVFSFTLPMGEVYLHE